jgi:AcrR family transcriptional regulator
MYTSRKERKSTQRERLLAGMLTTVVRKGYAGATVADVIAHAGVSRPTFYDYFLGRDDCFLAVHEHMSARLLQAVAEAVRAQPPEQAVQAGVRALIALAEAKPDGAKFLVNETLAAGSAMLDARDRMIAAVAGLIEDAAGGADPDAPIPDLPTDVLVGGVCNALAPRLRRKETALRQLSDEICAWVESYCQPKAGHRWRSLEPGPQLPPPQHVSGLALRPPPPLPPGRPNVPSAEVTRNQRERILYATAEVGAAKGYIAATVADISSAAGVDRRIFYANFRDKQDAFLAVHELGFQQVMAVCASAFFSASTWPERIWEGLRAGTHFDATYPVFSHIKYVEAYALGSSAIQRVEDSHAAFTIFVQEGYLHATSPPARSVLDAIAATGYEIGYHHARRRIVEQLPRMTPHAAYLVLTPFLGPETVNDFIDEQLAKLAVEGDAAAAGAAPAR